MSIDAIVSDVRYNDDGTATLLLADGGPGRINGQPAMTVVNPNPHLFGLIGLSLWGNSEVVLHGDTILFDRIGYTQLRMREART